MDNHHSTSTWQHFYPQPSVSIIELIMADEIPKTAQEYQQVLADLCGARSVMWDLYNADDQGYLKRKICMLMPDAAGDDSETKKQNAKLKIHRDQILETVWNQRKYYGGNLLMSIIYIVCTKLLKNEHDALNETDYSIFPLFRVRKCYKNDDSSNCCMIFVDDNGRVYQSWKDYKENNTLPEGILVAPLNGYYDCDNNDRVKLECFRTPASSFLSQASTVANTTAGLVGLGAAGVTVAAIALPVAAPVMAVAAVMGIGSGIWSAVSSVSRLVDRGQHEQSINVTDSQARADWLGVAGGAVALGASGATSIISRYAATGRNVSVFVRGSVNTLNFATIAINGVGVGNGIYDIVLKKMNDEEISSIDILQLGASLFLVTHSVYNFRTASQIVRQSQDSKIQSMRKQLSNRQRKAFDRLSQETIRLQGADRGKMDIIRSLKNMPDSKQPLNDVFKINKQLNQNNLKASLAPDGSIVLNNDLKIDSATLRQTLQFGSPEPILQNVGPAPVVGNLPPSSTVSPQSASTSSLVTVRIVSHVINIVGNVAASAISDENSLIDCVNNILENVCVPVLDILLDIVRDFYSNFIDEISQQLRRFIPFEETLWQAFRLITDQCGGQNLDDYIQNLSAGAIIRVLMEFYRQSIPQLGNIHECKECGGKYSICAI